MKARKYTDGRDWLLRAIENDGGTKIHSAHFDQFNGFDSSKMIGISSFEFGVNLMTGVRRALNAEPSTFAGLMPLVVFPLGTSESIMPWSDKNWGLIGSLREPPSIYVINATEIFDLGDEEYKRLVDLPVSCNMNISALYRCHRNSQAMQHSWEFSNDIYILES